MTLWEVFVLDDPCMITKTTTSAHRDQFLLTRHQGLKAYVPKEHAALAALPFKYMYSVGRKPKRKWLNCQTK